MKQLSDVHLSGAPLQTHFWYALALLTAIAGTSATVNEVADYKREEAVRFNYDASYSINLVSDRLDGYFNLLASMRLTFQDTPPTLEQFSQYYDIFDISYRYPGVRVLTYAACGPDGSHPITMISPLHGNEKFIGRDIARFSGPAGRQALEFGRDTGKMTFSGNIIRPRGPTDHPAISLRLPVYRLGIPPATPSARKADYRGSLGVGVALDETLAGLGSDTRIRIRLYDGGEPGVGREQSDATQGMATLWDSSAGAADPPPTAQRLRRNFTLANRVWVIEASADPPPRARSILISGTSWTLLLTIALIALGFSGHIAMLRRLRVDLLEDLNAQITTRNIELLRLASERSAFVANMSHELRSPLNAIMGFSQLLQDELIPETGRKKAAATIYTSGQHLLSLVNDILDSSKLDAGAMELHMERAAVAELLEGSLYMFSTLADSHHIHLEMESTVAGFAVMDVRKVRQITYNLLSNAVKFTPDGGTVALRARKTNSVCTEGMRIVCPEVTREDESVREYLEITVVDSGIGITQEGLDKLFTPFKQLDCEQSRQHQGTGLGLVLVKQLVSLHDGGLAVASIVGVGTTFKVWLPYQSA